MILTREERQLLEGEKGPTLQKVMNTLVRYAQALDANRFVDIEGWGHFAIPDDTPGLGPPLAMIDELVSAGLKTKYPFTLDPRSPQEFENLMLTPEQGKRFKNMQRNQSLYDHRMRQLGLLNDDAYTCTPYFPEVGNIPQKGTVLAWSESSCVVYANSVIGARTNRNAAVMDLLSNIIGKTPLCGLLTDEGRQASWSVTLNTSALPNPQLFGAAIGMTVLEDVPYIIGLDRFLGTGLNEESRDYLKEMGAACAAIGAVGLFHAEGLTPEAVEQGRALLRPDHRTYVVDNSELNSLMASYPVKWGKKDAAPQKCFIGCPHLSLRELYFWSNKIMDALNKKGCNKLAVTTILCAAPQVIQRFKTDKKTYTLLKKVGIRISATCPEAYLGNDLCAGEAIITNSNKLRTFTSARMFLDDQLLEIMVSGHMKGTTCK
jgi:predicted aconitase